MSHDYIVQMIQRFAELVGRLGGLRDEKRYDEAEEAIGDALKGAFGPLLETLDDVAPQAVPALANNPEKVDLYCALLRESARIASARGDRNKALRLTRRATAVEGAAHALHGGARAAERES